MNRESILPKDEAEWLALRKPNVNSTEIASLFNASPYLTHAELFYNKKNGDDVLPFEENDRSKWGKRLQNSIAYGIGDDQGWKVTPLPNYARLRDSRIGCSFDFIAETKEGDALLEIKNVDGLVYRNGWIETDFGLEAPEHIEIQVQAQMHISGVAQCFIGALIGGNRVVLLKRDYDAAVGRSLEAACKKFWHQVETNTPPPFDFIRDADLISALYAQSTKGKTIQATDDVERVMSEYKEAAARASEANDIKDARCAELLTLAGDAEKILGLNYTASLGMVDRKEYTVKASTYRNVRIYAKKEKAA